MSSRSARLLAALLAMLLMAVGAAAQERKEEVPAALVIKLDSHLDTPMIALIRRAIDRVRGGGTQYLVLDVQSNAFTPEEIRRAAAEVLPALQDENLATVAYIDESAFPAATMLALGCDQVFMKRGAQLNGFTAVEADFAELRQLMADALTKTERHGPGLKRLVEAMVDPEMRIYEVTYKDASGLETRQVVEEARMKAMQADPNIQFSVAPVPFDTRPLSLEAQRALDLGLITGIEDSLENMIKERLLLDSSQIGYMVASWSESAVAWLNGMREVLFVLGFILLLIEFKTPGFALPGVLGVMMFALAFFGTYMVGLANLTEILLFFLGLGLLACEIYVFPGVVVFGVAGFLCIVAGLIFSQQPFYFPSNAAESQMMLSNLINFGLIMVTVMVGIWAVYTNINRIPILRKAVQAPPEPHAAGGGGRDGYRERLEALAGRSGVLRTDLRPAGVVTIDGDPYDVVSEGQFIDKGTEVRVIEVRGNRIVVAPAAAPDAGERGEAGTIALLGLLVLVGLAFVVAEVFFPSFGILAILAGVSLVSAVFLAFTQEGMAVGFTYLVVCAIAVPVVIAYAFKVLPTLPFGKHFYLAGANHDEVQGGAQEAGLGGFLDKTGVALCDLRPAGYAEIDGRRVDVVTRGELIEKGSPLRVVKVELNQVVVARDRP